MMTPMPAPAMLHHALQRLTAIVGEETAALRLGNHAGFQATTNRKVQGLMDLRRAARGLDRASLDTGVAENATALRAALLENSRMLQVHIDAVRAVTDLLADVIQRADSDGTYLRHSRTQRPS